MENEVLSLRLFIATGVTLTKVPKTATFLKLIRSSQPEIHRKVYGIRFNYLVANIE